MLRVYMLLCVINLFLDHQQSPEMKFGAWTESQTKSCCSSFQKALPCLHRSLLTNSYTSFHVITVIVLHILNISVVGFGCSILRCWRSCTVRSLRPAQFKWSLPRLPRTAAWYEPCPSTRRLSMWLKWWSAAPTMSLDVTSMRVNTQSLMWEDLDWCLFSTWSKNT